MSEIEARLARRLAIAFWKGERAERIEVALFDAAPKLRPPQAGFQWEQADPLTTFDLKRFNAVRGHQAQQGREISRCLKELRQLRKDALAEGTDEPAELREFTKRTREPPAARQRRRARASRIGRAGRPGTLANEPCLVGLWQKVGPHPLQRGGARGRRSERTQGAEPEASVIPPRIHVSPNG